MSSLPGAFVGGVVVGVAQSLAVSAPIFYEKLRRRDEPWDIALAGWAVDYPDPANMLNVLFDGRSSENLAHLDDPVFNRRLRTAAGLSGERRLEEAEVLGALVGADQEAPAVVLDVVLDRGAPRRAARAATAAARGRQRALLRARAPAHEAAGAARGA